MLANRANLRPSVARTSQDIRDVCRELLRRIEADTEQAAATSV